MNFLKMQQPWIIKKGLMTYLTIFLISLTKKICIKNITEYVMRFYIFLKNHGCCILTNTRNQI